MRYEWIKCTLGDMITFQRGHDLPKSKMKKGVYPVIGSNGIIGYHNDYTTENPSITIGRSGNVGKPFIYYGRTWSHNTTLYVKDYKGNDPVFIYYFLKILDLDNYAGGSAVPTLNRNHIHTLPIKIPADVLLQHKIAEYLQNLDNKIQLNNEINNNLEPIKGRFQRHQVRRTLAWEAMNLLIRQVTCFPHHCFSLMKIMVLLIRRIFSLNLRVV